MQESWGREMWWSPPLSPPGYLAWGLTWRQAPRCCRVPAGQWQPSSQPSEKQSICPARWAQL